MTDSGPAVGAPRAALKTSNQALVRRGNRLEVLQLIIDGGSLASRASIARATGLTSATASSIVAELIDSELVENAGLADSTGGKPATSLRVRTDRKGLGVIIVRRHSVRAAVIDLAGDVVVEIEPFRTTGVIDIDAIESTLSRLCEATPLSLLAIGIDSPGAIANGVILESVQLDMHGVRLTERLSATAPCELYLINDADADALREYTLDPPEDGNLFSLSLGVGVGGAFVLDGASYSGPRSLGGELGHIRVDFADDALECDCGRRGCLERLTALPHLLGIDDENLVAPENDAELTLPSSLDAVSRIDLAAQLTARMIVTMCAAIRVHTVVIGGGAPRLGSAFLASLQRTCDELRPVGTKRLELRYATGAITLPYRGGAEHALRQALGVRWSAPPSTAARHRLS
jgi:predicted NBD/HSP70 family sugar kinase